MGFIPARCTQCGAEITVDDTKDAGICKYCGTAFVTEKAINNYNTYVTNDFSGATVNIVKGDINNMIHLAENALYAEKFQEACDFSNKALEIDSCASKAWFVKLRAKANMIDPKHRTSSFYTELTQYGNSALIYAEGVRLMDNAEFEIDQPPQVEQLMESVYTTYLMAASTIMMEASWMISDTSELHNRIILENEDKELVKLDDQERRTYIEQLILDATLLRQEVPEKFIAKNKHLHELVKMIAESYVSFCHGDLMRLSVYDDKLPDYIIKNRDDNLKKLTSGLSENTVNETESLNDQVKEMQADQIFATDKNSLPLPQKKKEGCYIATAVYGSYDAPEVLVLRRFRDTKLLPYLPGRLFVKAYYAISPILVRHLGNNSLFKSLCRNVLNKIISTYLQSVKR